MFLNRTRDERYRPSLLTEAAAAVPAREQQEHEEEGQLGAWEAAVAAAVAAKL